MRRLARVFNGNYRQPLGVVIPGHARWEEFCKRLEGSEGCDFTDDGGYKWRCKGGYDKSYAERILRSMGATDTEIAEAFAYFNERGGHCDCEILFNVA